MIFESGDDNRHKVDIAGADQGAAGFTDNFAWGKLDLSGQMLELDDGDSTTRGALYVHKLLGVRFTDDADDRISNLSGSGLMVYYDLTDPDNAYLQGRQFELGMVRICSPRRRCRCPRQCCLWGRGWWDWG